MGAPDTGRVCLVVAFAWETRGQSRPRADRRAEGRLSRSRGGRCRRAPPSHWSARPVEVRTVPFENLDVHTKRPIVLNLEKIYEKIVTKKRGGFCYELNPLFGWALVQLGFQVELLNCQVYKEDAMAWGSFCHVMCQVIVSTRRYIVDVGFGEPPTSPLTWVQGQIPSIPSESREEKCLSDGYVYCITSDDVEEVSNNGNVCTYFTLWRKSMGLPGLGGIMSPKGCWERRLRWKDGPTVSFEDLHAGLQFVQTNSASWFTQKVIITMFQPQHRVTMSGRKLIRTAMLKPSMPSLTSSQQVFSNTAISAGVVDTGDERVMREEKHIKSEKDYQQNLKVLFNIDLLADPELRHLQLWDD